MSKPLSYPKLKYYTILFAWGFRLRVGFWLIFVVMVWISNSYSQEENNQKYKFSLSLGATKASGNIDTSTLNLKSSFMFQSGNFITNSNLNTMYSYNRGRKTAERISFDNRFEMKFKPYFYFMDANYYRNPFQAYEHSFMLSVVPGVGRYIFDEKDLYLTVSYYPYYVHSILNRISVFSNTDTENYLMHNFEARFSKNISENAKFKTKFIYRITDRTLKDYFIVSENSIITKMTKHFGIELAYNIYYQNIPVLTKVERVDTTFSTLLQLNF